MSNIFVRGTGRSLTCNVTLASYSPSSPNITVQWMKDGLLLDVSSERVDQNELQVNGNSYTSTITFSPLNSTDTGDYTCTGTISPIGSGFDVDVEPYIVGTNNDVSYTLTVQDMLYNWLNIFDQFMEVEKANNRTRLFLISISITFIILHYDDLPCPAVNDCSSYSLI